MSETENTQQRIDFQERAKQAIEKRRIENGQEGDVESEEPGGELVLLPPRSLQASLKIEQNLGCELPVCVSNRNEVDKENISVETDDGVIWKLERTASGKLPAPEHYSYWLWFLDRCQAAGQMNITNTPKIPVNPTEIFDLFGGPKGGTQYSKLDDAFSRFSLMVASVHTAFFSDGNEIETDANLGTLCYYQSWRHRPEKGQEAFEFAKGWVAPGELLWSSIRSGYLKSVPLKPLKGLSYVGQRLYTYLLKHCPPGGEFSISPRKLLPKIPANIPSKHLKLKLTPHHNALAKEGFLADVEYRGRGKDRIIVYRRS